jgi:hypothetical protein
MAATPTAQLKAVQDLLRAGKVQEADDLLGVHIAAAPAAPGAAAPAPAPPAPPRPATSVITDIFDTIHLLLGAPPQLENLLGELKSIESWF